MRLEKYLSDCGIGTRKEIKQYIKAGRVSLDGDAVLFDGVPLVYNKYRYFAMNKPAGYVCANDDSHSQTVFSLLDSKYQNLGLFTVGRLDKDTTGLLLLTNDGDFAHKVISPKSHINKLYFATINGNISDDDILKFSLGFDGFLPAKLERAGDNKCFVTVQEGKYHQVKRMLVSIGKPVIQLKRLKIGSFMLPNDLEEGSIVELSQIELDNILL